MLGGVQWIDSRCGKRASVIGFFSAPTVVGGPVVAVAAPVLLSIDAVRAREAPTPMPRGQGWSRHLTAKPGASFLLLPFAFAVVPMDGLGQFHGTFFG